MFLQAVADSTAYKIGYSVGSWLPFILLGIGLTIMILLLRKKRKVP
jgi:ATP/ADP translocase